LVDTAGIRETEDIVEKIGVERSRQVLQDADLILLVLNNNESLSDDDFALFEAVKDFEFIVIINKTDLPQKLNLGKVKELAEGHPIVSTSLLKEEGIDQLEAEISETFFDGDIDTGDFTYVSNVRHIKLLNQAKKTLEYAMDALEMEMPLDLVQIDVTRTWELLGEIIGDTASDALIDQLFSQFCLGK